MAFVKPDKFHAMAIKSVMNIENKYPQKIDICAIDSLSSATRNRNSKLNFEKRISTICRKASIQLSFI